jgi:hypothetical protein
MVAATGPISAASVCRRGRRAIGGGRSRDTVLSVEGSSSPRDALTRGDTSGREPATPHLTVAEQRPPPSMPRRTRTSSGNCSTTRRLGGSGCDGMARCVRANAAVPRSGRGSRTPRSFP